MVPTQVNALTSALESIVVEGNATHDSCGSHNAYSNLLFEGFSRLEAELASLSSSQEFHRFLQELENRYPESTSDCLFITSVEKTIDSLFLRLIDNVLLCDEKNADTMNDLSKYSSFTRLVQPSSTGCSCSVHYHLLEEERQTRTTMKSIASTSLFSRPDHAFALLKRTRLGAILSGGSFEMASFMQIELFQDHIELFLNFPGILPVTKCPLEQKDDPSTKCPCDKCPEMWKSQEALRVPFWEQLVMYAQTSQNSPQDSMGKPQTRTQYLSSLLGEFYENSQQTDRYLSLYTMRKGILNRHDVRCIVRGVWEMCNMKYLSIKMIEMARQKRKAEQKDACRRSCGKMLYNCIVVIAIGVFLWKTLLGGTG